MAEQQSRGSVPVLQAVGIIAPTLYTGKTYHKKRERYENPHIPLVQSSTFFHPLNINPGFTFAYPHVLIPPLTTHAPPKLLARQWLQAYRFAPTFVAPLVMLGTASNALLAYLFFSSSSFSAAAKLYGLAALATASIAPYTALYMEPGVNGAGKWKARELLGGDEVVFKGMGRGTERDSATGAAKSWAEGVDMKCIVETWARLNAWRYVITAAATICSAGATVLGR